MRSTLYFISFFFFALPVFAARMDIVFPDTVSPDATGILHIFLDTEGTQINIVSAELNIPEGITLLDVQTGSSALSLWVKEPRIENNTLSFIGVIPNGIVHHRVPIIDVVFRANILEATNTPIIGNAFVFENSLDGTQQDVFIPETISWSVTINSENNSRTDHIPPEPFSVTLFFETNEFGWYPVAIFSAIDKQSGIDYFEVQEHTHKIPEIDGWVRAQSPTRISENAKNVFVSVKAVDHEGNIRIVTLSPHRGYKISILLIFIGLLGLLVYVLFKRKKV